MISPAAPDSLAFIGHAVGVNAVTPIVELQSRYLTALYKGTITLPSAAKMEAEIEKHVQWIRKTRYLKDDACWIDMWPYLDDLAREIGCDSKSRLGWGLWLRNRKLYNQISKGPLSGHQYRYWSVCLELIQALGSWCLGWC
jgi:hypothetical protein